MLLTQTSIIGQFIHPVGWGKEGGSLFQPAKSFTLLEYMKIWCKILVPNNKSIVNANKKNDHGDTLKSY